MPSNNQGQKPLPKVTQYVLNLGKSVAYATAKELKGSAENTADFIETNQELFKDIYAGARNYKRTAQLAQKSIQRSKVYEAGVGLRDALFDSIRSGRFYDPKREAEYQDKAGGSLGVIDDGDDWGFNSNTFDIKDGDDHTDANIVTSAMKDAATAQAGITAKAAEYLAESEKASTKLLFAQGEKMYSTVTNGLAGTQTMLKRVNEFLEGPLTTHIENSTKFYTETTNILRSIEGLVKESTEMQRNIYKSKQDQQYKRSQFGELGTTAPDLKEYAKIVKKNLYDVLPSEVTMLLGNDGDDTNLLMGLVANPLEFIPAYAAKALIPKMVKNSIEAFDQTMTGVFGQFIARMNKAAANPNYDTPQWLETLGKIFGLRMKTKTSIDPSKYEKGAVPFDGIVKKAIIDVIPGHLARIEAALTGGSERVFDFESGKWTNIKAIAKENKQRQDRAIRDATSEVTGEYRSYLAELARHDMERSKDLEAQFEGMLRKIYEDRGIFEPFKAHGYGDDKMAAWEYYGFDKESDFIRAAKSVTRDKGKAMNMANDAMYAIESLARYYENAESGNGVGLGATARHLYNNAFDKSGNRTELFKGSNNIITQAVDEYNHNLFYYLRNIHNMMGGTGAGPVNGPSGGGGNGPTGSGNPYSRENMRRRGGRADDATRYRVMNNIYESARARGANKEKPLTGEEFDKLWDDKQIAREEEKRIRRGELDHNDTSFLDSLLKASTLGKKWEVIQNGLNALSKKPALYLTGLLDTADKRIFTLFFGGKETEDKQIVDKDGNRIKGFLDYLIFKTQESFDKLNDWIDEHVLTRLKKFLDENDKVKKTKQFGKDVWARMKVQGSQIKDRFKRGWANTYGAAWDAWKYRRAHGGMSQDEYSSEWEDYDDEVETFANGGLITRRGLAVVSPGERIIPNNRNRQHSDLAAEKAFARAHGLHGVNYYAHGYGSDFYQGYHNKARDKAKQAADQAKQTEETIKKVAKEVSKGSGGKGIADVIASTIIGGGFTTLAGVVGGPLLGAAVGSAVGIAKNSQTVQRLLFGEDVTDEKGNVVDHKGGLISPKLQKKLNKYLPTMGDFGIAGGLLGLLTPMGLIGGTMMGAAVGFAKENDRFQEFLWGNDKLGPDKKDGLFKKEFREKLKKAAPSMLIGAAGAALLGPFGLLGNAVMGSALGFATTTDTFKNAILGKEETDETGKKRRVGGLVGALYNGAVKPLKNSVLTFIAKGKDFIEKTVIPSTAGFIKSIANLTKDMIRGFGDRLKDLSTSILEKTIGRPLADFIEHRVLGTAGKILKGVLWAPGKIAKGAINAPFALMRRISAGINNSRITSGNADEMSAAQRMSYRLAHPFATGKHVDLLGRTTDFSNIDSILAKTKSVDELKKLKDQADTVINARRKYSKKIADMIEKAGKVVSEFFNEPSEVDPNHTRYDLCDRGNTIKKIHRAVAKGSMSDVDFHTNRLIMQNLLTPAELSDFNKRIIPYVERIAQLLSDKDGALKDANDARKALKRALKTTFKGTNSVRKLNRLLGKEIDVREAEEAEARAKGEAEAAKPENVVKDEIIRQTDRIHDVLVSIASAVGAKPKKRKKKGAAGDPQVEKDNPSDDDTTNEAKLRKQPKLIRLLSKIHNSTFGGWFRSLLKVGIGVAVGGAALGHLADFVKRVVWPAVKPIAKRIWEGEDGNGGVKGFFRNIWEGKDGKGGIKGMFPKVASWVQEKIVDPFKKVVGWIKEGTFWENVFGGVLNWFRSGWSKLNEIVLKPVFTGLKAALYDWWQHKDDDSDAFLRASGSVEANSTTITDSSGKTVGVSSGMTQTYKNETFGDWWKNARHGRGHSADSLTIDHKNAYDQEFKMAVHKDGTKVFIECISTGEYIRIPCKDGKMVGNTFEYGYLCDNKGTSMTGGATIGFIAGAAGTVAAGVALGIFTFGIGTIAAVVAGAGMSILGSTVAADIYETTDGRYFSEAKISTTKQKGIASFLFRFFGWSGDVKSWPTFVKDSDLDQAIAKSDFTDPKTISANEAYKLTTGNDIVKGNRSQYTNSHRDGNNSTRQRGRGGRGHIYQNDPAISGLKFGNSTFGEAGCGPVAAANLMNKMSGGGNGLAAAANFATGYQNSDGSVSPDYFTDLFGGYQTSNKRDLMKKIRAGVPTFLLGHSNGQNGTPFGSGDHYITAMGTDKQGNIIAEDPDLPGSSYKYPANKVLNDTTVGMPTAGKARSSKFRFGKFRGGKANTIRVSKMAERSYAMMEQLEAGGRYGAINKNDNGALSIGKIQWHGCRAHDLMMMVINNMGADQAREILGEALYKEITTKDRNYWNKRIIVNDSESKKISALISTPIGQRCQDVLAMQNIDGYIESIKKQGVSEENAILYCADFQNQYGSASKLINACKSAGLSLTLDNLHQTALQNFGKYASRRQGCYDLIKKTSKVGSGSIEISDIASYIPNKTLSQTTVDLSSGYSMQSSGNRISDQILSQTQEQSNALMDKIFGSGLMNVVRSVKNKVSGAFSGNTTSTGDTSNYAIAPSTGNGTQKSIVDAMASKMGQLKYSQEGSKQNPDNGSGSCASTVAWAYKKALGIRPGDSVNGWAYMNSTQQAKDSNFKTIYTNNGRDLVDTNKLQPGDIMYYNWKQTANNGDMSHTEMYAGNNQDLSHGGPGLGPTYRNLTNGRKKNLMMVRRYKGFGRGGSAKANDIIRKYGINTSNTVSTVGNNYNMVAQEAMYDRFLGAIIELLATIATNTEGLAEVQKALAQKGVQIDYEKLEKAAGNARKRAAKARAEQSKNAIDGLRSLIGDDDMSDLANSPTATIVAAMEKLASD